MESAESTQKNQRKVSTFQKLNKKRRQLIDNANCNRAPLEVLRWQTKIPLKLPTSFNEIITINQAISEWLKHFAEQFQIIFQDLLTLTQKTLSQSTVEGRNDA